MLRVLALAFAITGMVASAPARAMEIVDLNQSLVNASVATATVVTPFGDLIDWKVGDHAEYNVSIGGLPFGGSSTKTVTKDEGTAIWLKQVVNVIIQKETVELLIEKATGKTLKMIRNGKEEQIPDEKIEIISTDYTEVKVPAGQFKCLHIVAKSPKVKQLEIWANPKEVPMDGAIKQLIVADQASITMELKSFKKN